MTNEISRHADELVQRDCKPKARQAKAHENKYGREIRRDPRDKRADWIQRRFKEIISLLFDHTYKGAAIVSIFQQKYILPSLPLPSTGILEAC
jgi:hypothetical protein